MNRSFILGLALLVCGCGSSGSSAPDKDAGSDAGEMRVREAAARIQSLNNLKQIGIAMHNYHDNNHSLPPAAIFDKSSKPLLSWRVLLLPYLEQDPLYHQFKLDEPWDSEHNKKLLASMPKVYAPPAVPGLKVEPNCTFYQVFVGDQTPFLAFPIYLTKEGKPVPADKAERLEVQLVPNARLPMSHFRDGTSNTFLVVEAGEAVPWTKPQDLPSFAGWKQPQLGGLFKNRFQALMADGSVRIHSTKGLSDEVLRALITPSGGEDVDLDQDPPVIRKPMPVTKDK
jgi:hypothetical protein